MNYIEKEKLIKADIASIENRVRHAFNQGYDLGFKDGKEKAKPLEPTTKKDLEVEAEDCISTKVLNEAIDHVEDYVCNHEKNTYRAQGMREALTMIEEYIREQSE